MDQLQQDAAKSHDLWVPRPKRRDSLMADSSESSANEESPLLDEKMGAIVEADGLTDWRSPRRSTKMLAANLNEWGRSAIKTLVDKFASTVGATSRQEPEDHHDALEMQQESGKVEYLMLCIACEQDCTRLVQVKLSQPPASDAEFFRLLASEYLKIRRCWFGIKPFWRKVDKIHFVRFETLAPYQLQQLVQVTDFGSRPVQGHTGWIWTEGAVRPPKPRQMATFLKYPKRAGETRELSIFPKTPRKLHSDIQMRPDEIGWGLYYAEEPRSALVLLLTSVGGVAVFLIVILCVSSV